MIQKLTKNEIESVIDLHLRVLGNTLNSRVGPWFLKKLYGVIEGSIDNGYCFIYIESHEIIGFISFCLDREQLEKWNGK